MLPSVTSNMVMGFYFFPRGGSAQVARYVCRALAGSAWQPTLFAGSLGVTTASSNAARFFSGIPCNSLDYSPAWSEWSNGADAMAARVPMHASYENKPGVPDRSFFELDDAAFDRQVASWIRFFSTHTSLRPSVAHLHHLTPMHAAAHVVWPDVPIITHLHGTELKMLATAEYQSRVKVSEPWRSEWIDRMRRWAADSHRVVVASAQDRELAQRLLPLESVPVVTIASGVDTEVFTQRIRYASDRRWLWRRWLVDDPRGWRPGLAEGSLRYSIDDLSAFTDQYGSPVPVVVFAGRFMQFKRLQLLIEAHHALRSMTSTRSVLVVVGGFPGEWEGEHPYDTVQRLGAQGVFFMGWRDHDDLGDILQCGDVFAAPAVDEPFGLVYLEAMATGLAPIATNTGGPSSFINVDPNRPTGWLVPPDDFVSLAQTLAEAISNRAERTDRGARAAQFVRENYSWLSAAQAFAQLYADSVDEQSRTAASQLPPPASGVA